MADSNRRDFGTNFAYHGTELKRQKTNAALMDVVFVYVLKSVFHPHFIVPIKTLLKKFVISA